MWIMSDSSTGYPRGRECAGTAKMLPLRAESVGYEDGWAILRRFAALRTSRRDAGLALTRRMDAAGGG